MRTFNIQQTRIRVQPAPDAVTQQLRIQATPWGKQLAHILGQPQLVGEEFWLEHSPALDARLCLLTDLFIALRYQHPTLLQLHLFLEEEVAL